MTIRIALKTFAVCVAITAYCNPPAALAQGSVLNDDASWAAAEADGLIASWQGYLRAYPGGAHAVAANARIAAREKTRLIWTVQESNSVLAAAISPDGRTILSGGNRDALVLRNLISGQPIRSFASGQDKTFVLQGDTGLITDATFAPDGKTALTAHRDRALRLWDVASGALIRSYIGHQFPAKSVAFSPDGKTALSGGEDETTRLWDVATAQPLRTFKSRITVEVVAFTPSGRTALSTGFGDAKFWDPATGGELQFVMPYGLAKAPGGQLLLVSAVADAFQREIAGETVRALKYPPQPGTIYERARALAPDGKSVLFGVGGTLVQLDVATGRELHRFTGHTRAFIQVVAFAPDGRTALSGGDDNTLRLWDLSGL